MADAVFEIGTFGIGHLCCFPCLAPGGEGAEGFGALQQAIAAGGPFRYVAFDLLHLDGRDLTGQPHLKIRKLPRFVMRTAGLAVPIARELAEMDYQFYAPFMLDSTLTERTFGLAATDLDVALREVAAAADATAARTM